MPLPLRMSYNEEITTISLARHCEHSEAIQYHLLVIANAVKQSRCASNWIATLTLAMTATLKPSEISLLQGKVSFKPSEISLLQGRVSFKSSEISLLQGGVSFKSSEISLLQGGVSFKSSEISLLQGGYPSRISHFHKKKHFLFLKQERK